MTQADYDHASQCMTVRELRAGHKALVTTLLCPKQTDKAAIASLYQSRWHVELDLRYIKITLGMERLSCQTPAMAAKEIWVYLLAYNLIQLMMAQAALCLHLLPRQISFKQPCRCGSHGAGRRVMPSSPGTSSTGCLLSSHKQRVGERPGRIEPRAVKRRPKTYPLLTTPRALARAHVRKYGYPEKIK
jgi:hypothetical protein